MKTDKFDDVIRRKLESIEPPFRERDWAHMQAFMHGHGYPPAWAGAGQWLVPMAAAVAVTGLIISTVWQFQTNRELSQSVQTLSKTVARLETTQANLIKIHNQTDTVYVTNFTKTIPSVNNTDKDRLTVGQPDRNEGTASRAEERYAHQPVNQAGDQPRGNQPRRGMGSKETQTEPSDKQFTLDESPKPGLSATPNRMAQEVATQQHDGTTTAFPDRLREQPLVDTPTERAGTAKSDRTVSRTPDAPTRTNPASPTERLTERTPSETGLPASRSAANQPQSYQRPETVRPYAATKPSAGRQAGLGAGVVAADKETAPRQPETITVNSLGIRPLPVDSAYYSESMARRTRRIRSLLPAAGTVLPAATAPAEITSSRPAWGGIRVRLGVSGELGTAQRAAGGYGEVLVGRHWSVGVGLNRVHIQGGQFGSEEQFKQMTHNDFRRLYAPRTDPFLDIINIDQQFAIWQIPVSLSYRALLGRGFVLIPTVGMDFSVAAQETTTFTYRRGPVERNAVGLPPARPCDLFNAYTLALNAEKSWKHIVLQAGPVLSMPTQSLSDLSNPVSLGFRTRLLFQF